ncbi:MAG: hypothetical protein HRU20_01255 [Pseudomonadales bacterium]|nr:hypothetical protein [Pseudomonadales bacterium]
MKKFGLFSTAACFMLFSVFTHADTIELKNGKTLEGSFVGREGDSVSFEVDGISMSFKAGDVKNIAIGDSASKPEAAAVKAVKPATGPVEMPAGSVLTIRLLEALDTGKHSTGHKFTATLEGALIKDGVTVAPAGSRVYGKISEAVKARRVAGKAKMILTLSDINIGGQMIPIQSNAINAYTQATGKSTASKVARGAAIGALADGSSGAKTGAKVGLGVAVLKGGNQVHIPSSTLLNFTLIQALKSQ